MVRTAETHDGTEKLQNLTQHTSQNMPHHYALKKARDLEWYCFMSITNIIEHQTISIYFFGGSAVVRHN